MAYYNGKKVLSVVQVKEVEVDYYVGVATLETEKKDEIIVPQNIKVNNTDFPILDGTKTSVVELGGNSVAFNQLVKNGNFADTSEWSAFGGVLTTSGNVGSIVLSGAGSANRFQHGITPVLNHKYLVKFDIKASVTSRGYVQLGVMSDEFDIGTSFASISLLLTPTSSSPFRIYFNRGGTYLVDGNSVELRKVNIFTEMHYFWMIFPQIYTNLNCYLRFRVVL